MADQKISQLPPLTTPASTDVLAIVDVAANTTKKIEVQNLVGTGGGVSAVTGTAPITSTGGTTPDIGITNATPSADGAMSAADKAKLDGIAAGAQVGTVTDVTAGTGLAGGTITGTGTISLDADLADLNNVAATVPNDGEVLTYDSVNGWQPEAVSGTGTVTSVGVTGGTGIASSGGPITTSGSITVSLDADLADLNNVAATAPTDGQVLTYDTINGWQPEDATGGGIAAVVDDTTPQLGGNLDVQGFEIDTSTTNGNIKLNPNGSGFIEAMGDGTTNGTAGAIQLNCSNNSHGVKIQSPAHSAAASYTLTLPENDGSLNQPIVSDGSGVLSFSDTVKATLQGSVTGAQIDFKAETVSSTSAGDAEGTVVYFGSAGTTAGKVYTFSSGDWVAVDASVGGEDTTKGLLAMALGTVPATNGMLIQGIGVLDHNPGVAGNILYVTTGTAGELTATQPSTADEYSRVVAHQIGIEGGARAKVLFTPSQDWIKIA